MNYDQFLKQFEASSHIINMTSFDGIIKTGLALNLNEQSTVLDLCCGYGEMLKIWHETFGICGTGVDMCTEFIYQGKARLEKAGITGIQLVEGDIFKYSNTQKYDVVSCTETFNSIDATLAVMEKFVKPSGRLVYCHVYAKIQNPPQELVDFDGELPTLDELYNIFRGLGYYLTHITRDTVSEWDRYISWSAQRDLARLRQNKDDRALAEWIEKWWHMYFNYRLPYEGQAMFVLEKF